MRIGLSSIYSWRPHVEHIFFLARLLKEAGYHTSFLTCDADLSSCYTKELRPTRLNITHCSRCIAGGIRSYTSQNVFPIGRMSQGHIQPNSLAPEWCKSSASTLGRYESDHDYASEDFSLLSQRLAEPTHKSFSAAINWIQKEKLDAILLFNGRMDATRGVLEAARQLRIPFISVERTWFGDGIQLLPNEDCLGLKAIDSMVKKWRDTPLTASQAMKAMGNIASRFLRKNQNEWRAYNLTAKNTLWPYQRAKRKILFVPGSRNEIWGHPDWRSGWKEQTDAYDALIKHLHLSREEIVIRCHPNWAEKIGSQTGYRAENHYLEWAKKNDLHCIASSNNTSTLSLIEQCDAIVVGGGSAALEAGILGKQIIAIAPSIYQQAGFQDSAYTPNQMSSISLICEQSIPIRDLKRIQIMRATLRFAYTVIYRAPQFVDNIHAITSTQYVYTRGADIKTLLNIFATGELIESDASKAADKSDEDDFLIKIAAREWSFFEKPSVDFPIEFKINIKRRFLFSTVDKIRECMPRGDL